MKKLGEGWQYTAYDTGDDRVLKKLQPSIKRHWSILKSLLKDRKHDFWKVFKYAKRTKEQARDSLNFIQQQDIHSSLIGNIEIVNEFDFIQDKVTPIKNYLIKVDLEKQKEAVHKFILFNKELVKLNFVDKTFNFGKNFGVTKDGKIILMDLGELIQGMDNIEEQLTKRPWSRPYVTEAIPPNLIDYFIEKMDESFIVE